MKHVLAIMVVMALALSAYADDFADQHAKALTANPTGVTFTVKLPKESFHMGEVIPVELAFSSAQPNRWELDGGLYDRGGRMAEDTYHVDPTDGTADPLREYFEFGAIGGGMRSMPTLTEQPHVMTFELNQWVRFDRPGKYRLFVTSSRVRDLSLPAEKRYQQVLSTTSNLISLEILPPDAAWETQQLKEIQKILATEKAEEPLKSAGMRLRFLGTVDSAPELARLFGRDHNLYSNSHWDCMFGLFGLRDRGAAVKAMEEELKSPEHAVTQTYLDTLARLKVLRDYPTTQPATQPAAWQEYWKHMSAANEEIAAKVMASLPAKRGEARAITVATMLEAGPNQTPDQRDELKSIMADLFPDLPPEEQRQLLDYRWGSIRTTELLPVLLRIYDRPAGQDQYRQKQVRDLCLWRAYQLDPAKVRPMILDAMAHPSGQFTRSYMRSLLALPDATLPELDEKLARLMEDRTGDDREVAVKLVGRYASAAIEPQVKEVYIQAGGQWPDELEQSLVAYFLRVDPDYGLEVVKQSLANRENRYGCWLRLLDGVAGRQWTPQLEAVVIETLQDPLLDLSTSAARALQKAGSPASKDALLAAMRAEWTPDSNDARSRGGDAVANRRVLLAQALVNARNFMLSAKELDEVEKLLGDRKNSSDTPTLRALLKGPVTISLYYSEPDTLRCHISFWEFADLPALERKMQQFPPGTVFHLADDGRLAPESAAVREQLRQWAAGQKITLTDPRPPADPAP